MMNNPDSFQPLSDCCDIYFQKTEKSNVGKHGQAKQSDRVFKTINFCKICKLPQTKYIDHMENKHSDCQEWINIMALENIVLKAEDKKKLRLNLLTKLKNEGNHEHNMEVLEQQKGLLIIARAPKGDDPFLTSDFNYCPTCLLWVRNVNVHRSSTSRCKLRETKMSKREVQHASKKDKTLDHAAMIPYNTSEHMFEESDKDDMSTSRVKPKKGNKIKKRKSCTLEALESYTEESHEDENDPGFRSKKPKKGNNIKNKISLVQNPEMEKVDVSKESTRKCEQTKELWKMEYERVIAEHVNVKKMTLTISQAKAAAGIEECPMLLKMIVTSSGWKLIKAKMNAQVQKIRRRMATKGRKQSY